MHALSVLAPKKFPIVYIYYFKMQIFPTEPVWNCDEDIFFHSTFLWWCLFQGLFIYKWQWRTKSSSTVVQGSIKRKPSSNIASFARDLNEDNVNWMSIVPIFVLVFTSIHPCTYYEQYKYTWPGLRAWTDQSRARRWLHPSWHNRRRVWWHYSCTTWCLVEEHL